MLDTALRRDLCSHSRDAGCPPALPGQHPAALPEKPPLQPEEQIQSAQGKGDSTAGG